MTRTALKQTAKTFLMFTGEAEAALALYSKTFDSAEIGDIERHGEGDMMGKIMRAEITIGGHTLMVSDSPPVHDFDFTPSMSIFVDCQSEHQFNHIFEVMSENGKVRMPPDNYGFSRKFSWTDDRFGVSWQINLP